MEQVNKHNSVIQKGVRNKVSFAKAQKDVEKSAKELVKLAKKAKDEKDVAKKGERRRQPREKWDEYIDEMVKTSEELSKVAGKAGASFQDAKDAFGKVKTSAPTATKTSASTTPSSDRAIVIVWAADRPRLSRTPPPARRPGGKNPKRSRNNQRLSTDNRLPTNVLI